MIKNIYFDMGGVIFDQNTEEAFRRFRSLGIDTDYYMGVYGQRDFFLDLETGRIDADTFCQRVGEVVGHAVSREQARDCWLGFCDGVPAERLDDLVTLRSSYRLGLLSNTNPFMMDFMRSGAFSDRKKSIADYFDVLFLSYEMRICKPDAEIFRQVLQCEGANAEECLFIDDSRKNTDAAKALGFQVLTVATNEPWMPKLRQLLDL